jgi:hypothetical protein
LPGFDVYDIDRDARTFPGGVPVVAHPPCRAWGALRHFAKPLPGERDLAVWAVDQVRKWGGVLEHPLASRLWPWCGLPAPGFRDRFGGFTLPIDQDWFGHRAQKATRLYVVGVEPRSLPPIPFVLEEPAFVVSPSANLRAGMPGCRRQLPKPEREHTPPRLAAWLVSVARLSGNQLFSGVSP